ncbi:hypothetical protein AAUPMB_06718, partial [Pasteurella multocida subsp. multocida str. Anand1_buffalo]
VTSRCYFKQFTTPTLSFVLRINAAYSTHIENGRFVLITSYINKNKHFNSIMGVYFHKNKKFNRFLLNSTKFEVKLCRFIYFTKKF